MPTYYARFDSNSANNPALNLNGDPAIQIDFVWESPTSPVGDVILEQDGGGIDPTSMVQIGGTNYTFTFEYTGTLPTPNRDGAQQMPEQFEGDPVYLITVHDYPAAGDSTRLAFLPDSDASQAEMDDFGKGAIDIQNLDLAPPPTAVCFCRGTLIATPQGERRIEDLKAGDHVLTANGRKARVRWLATSHFAASVLHVTPGLRPVCVPAGSIGPGQPHSDLWVSPQHRVLLDGWNIELTLGQPRVFVRAKHLGLPQPAPTPDLRDGVDYFHLLLDRHDIVVSNGLPTESFFPGGEALRTLTPDTRAELDQVLDKHQGNAGLETATALYTATLHEALLIRPQWPPLKIAA